MNMKIARRTFVGIVTSGLLAAGAAWADDIAKFDAAAALVPKSIAESATLRIAMPDQGKPFAYKEGNELKGMDVDMARAIAGTLGLNPEITLVPFAGALAGLEADKFDISFGQFYIRAERLAVADFVTSWRVYNTFLLKSDKDLRPLQVTDLCGYRAGTMAASVQLEELQKNADNCATGKIEVSAFPSASAAALALSSDRIDVMFTDPAFAHEVMKADKSLITSGELDGAPTAIAVRRDEDAPAMDKAIQAALTHLQQTGEYQKLLEANETAFGALTEFDIYDANSTPPSYQ
ncbi:transporter substrate-binding domain-containing protein [Albidovulum sp.]|uniref:transporter substrate-binding domain-containing protein n=1 Tax=Albidovulum sp. TaxID=1872424 RepID=UPI0039B89649